MKKKNILFIIDGLSGGGAERIVLTLAEAMVQQGHHVTLLSLRRECAYPIAERIDCLVLEDSYRGPFWRLTEIRRRARALDRLLANHFLGTPIDIAVSHLPKTDRIVAASHFLKEAWMCLHCALAAGELENKKGIQRLRKHHQLKRTYHGRKLITVSRALQEDVRALGIHPAAMVTIYNPLDFERVHRAAQEACPLDKEPFLLHVGRFNKQKRHDRLFEAFKKSGYPGKLVLLGSGTKEEEQRLQELIKKFQLEKQVLFAGFVPNPYPYMRTAEALLLSSDYEGLPNVLVEALACGTQPISTNCPYGPAEILQGPLAQGLCQLNATALAEAIQRVLANPIALTMEMLTPFLRSHSVEQYLNLDKSTFQ